ncbi:hypothetical protein [Achromobacter phage kwar_LB4]|nr:hypothetical protein [Achromobacter phage kwar_LB4]
MGRKAVSRLSCNRDAASRRQRGHPASPAQLASV